MVAQDNLAFASALSALVAAGDLAYEWDLVSDVIAWHGATALFGLPDGVEIRSGRAFAERINPDDLATRQQRLQAHYVRGSVFDVEYRLRQESGGFLWLHERGAAEFDEAGRPRRVRGVLRGITAIKVREEQLEHLANYDDLTGHFNKRRLRAGLEQTLAQSLRSNAPGAYLAIGIDSHDATRDAFGREAADAVIIEIGQRLDRCLRVSDVVGRVDGDRFGIVLANCAEEHVRIAADKILAAVSEAPVPSSSGPIYATISIGSASFPEPVKTAHEVIARAEAALAEAMGVGRHCFLPYRLTDEQRGRQHAVLEVGERVQSALRDRRLVFAYQPILDVDTGVVDYYECLLRMIAPDGKVIIAGAFVEAIEQLGFIRLVDRYVLEMAVREAAANPGIRLGFNISGLTASDRAWLRAAIALLKDRREVASRLVVEITETAALDDMDDCVQFVARLKSLGCRVALDDFGAGFMSLRHVQTLGADILKIDGSLVRNLVHSEERRIFVRHLVGLADGLDVRTIAECVETEQQAKILRAEGVCFLQGYHYGQPRLEKPWLEETVASGAAE